MSFIPEENRVENDALPEEKNPPEKKKGGSPINSLIVLILIGVALYYSRDFLSGEKEIPGLSHTLSLTAGKDAPPTPELKIPRINGELKPLLNEFKTEYEKLHPPHLITQTQPAITRIRYSKHKKSLLIILEQALPNSGNIEKKELIYQTDDFGRLVTTGEFAGIKLYPEQE